MTEHKINEKITFTKRKLHKLYALRIAKNWKNRNKKYIFLDACKMPRWVD